MIDTTHFDAHFQYSSLCLLIFFHHRLKVVVTVAEERDLDYVYVSCLDLSTPPRSWDELIICHLFLKAAAIQVAWWDFRDAAAEFGASGSLQLAAPSFFGLRWGDLD